MNDRSRPGQGSGSETVRLAACVDSTASTDIPRDLRRRRAASWRCEPLDDGRRDPLDKPRRNRVITVRAIGGNTVELTGCDRAVFGAIQTVGARYQRAPRGGAWLVQQDDAQDVMAMLSDVRGYVLQVAL